MDNLVISGLILIIIAVLVLPFSVKKVEEELEIFLFIMGILAVSISKIWSLHLVIEALKEPIPISITVLAMGFIFKYTRKKIAKITKSLIKKFKPEFVVFAITLTLGLSSSIITAIIASLIFSEIISIMKFKRDYEIKLTVLTCFAIGTGAALTPIGEPLSTIVVSKLKGEPHNADFFYLIKNLAEWIIPLLVLFSILSSIGASKNLSNEEGLQEEYIESNKTIIYRALKVYIFVMALVFLGNGINPLTNIFVTNLKPEILYWINSISAILDNATLAAAEIVPSLTDRQITFIIMGLIISGGLLIPGNIPNIICASKLNIKSKEWAKYGLIFGVPIMILCFIFLYFFA
jgi:predicted cation transporter